MNKELAVLIDGSNYFFRAYHALPKMNTSYGFETSAMLGLINMVLKIHKQYQPQYLAIAFDSKEKTFRHELLPEYKAQREKPADELIAQIAPSFEFIEALGFLLIKKAGIEADDIIGTLAERFSKEGKKVLICSGDKDMLQLLTLPNVEVLDEIQDRSFKAEDNLGSRFGVDSLNCGQVRDFLALCGDNADNISGIEGVGKKTAAKWLNNYGNIDNLIANLSEIKGKVGEKLKNSLEQLEIFKQLVSIKCDIELDLTFTDLIKKETNLEKLKNLCNQYEFSSLWKKYNESEELETELAEVIIIKDKEELNNLKNLILEQGDFAISFAQDNKNLVGIEFYVKEEFYYLPLTHQLAQNLEYAAAVNLVRELFNNPDLKKYCYDFKNILHLIPNIELINNVYDLMLILYCYDTDIFKLVHLLADYKNIFSYDEKDILHKGKQKLLFAELSILEVANFLRAKTQSLFNLAQNLELNELYKNLELPLSLVLFNMEKEGVLVDRTALIKLSAEFTEKLETIANKIYNLAGENFNINSNKELAYILYTKLELPVLAQTPKKQPSTDAEVLSLLAEKEHSELAQELLNYRTLIKLKSYTDKLPTLIASKTQRIHTTYNQAITITGRLSSAEPNLQNIPVRTEEGKKIRTAFIAENNNLILSLDYSQIELRVMAHMANDENLINAFKNGADIHSFTALELFGNSNSEYRRAAKTINFGLIYGMGANSLAKSLDISVKEAQNYIELYFNRYPKVKDFMNYQKEFALKNSFVETLNKRKIFIKDINSKNQRLKTAAQRLAINAPVQGTAAEIIKKAMINIFNYYHTNPNIKMLIQIHDELVFEIKEEFISEYSNKIKELMENAENLSLPLLVDISYAKSWSK